MRKQKWRNFTEAREFVRALKLSSMDGYRKYCKSGKKPKDIPTGPNIAYKKEWIRFGDWLVMGLLHTSIKHGDHLRMQNILQFY